MKPKFEEHAVIKLRLPRIEFGLNAGAIGTVCQNYEADTPAYLVEFADGSGVTIAILDLIETDIEAAELGNLP